MTWHMWLPCRVARHCELIEGVVPPPTLHISSLLLIHYIKGYHYAFMKNGRQNPSHVFFCINHVHLRDFSKVPLVPRFGLSVRTKVGFFNQKNKKSPTPQM